MNISRIQKMINQGDFSAEALRYLIDCHGECEHLDYKIQVELENDCAIIGIVKDMIGMKNIGGGYIVIGVKDKTWEPIGISESINLDTKKLRDLVQKYSGLDIECFIVEHSIYINERKRLFCLIGVRTSSKYSKLNDPSMCHVSYHEQEKWGIRKGDIYIRDGDQTVRLDDYRKLKDKLDDLLDKYQEADQLEATQVRSPFEIEAGLYRLLPREYITFVGREDLLTKIKSAIEKDPRIWIINLFGPGGVGKSALATRVAYDYYESRTYEAIIQLSAKDQELSTDSGIRSLNPSLISIEDFIDRILHLFSHQEYCKEDLTRKKKIVNELLCAWKTLIILDNMEAVNDGRIMEFVREFPPETKAKVLLTSRQRNSDWEQPIQVPEFSIDETREFIQYKSQEMDLDFPFQDNAIITKIIDISGGLPLAIQWILGDYSRTRNLKSILSRVVSNQSPLLEFSFRNSWNTLDEEAQEALAVLPLSNTAPTLQEWRTILDWSVEKIERAKSKLVESTFVTERTNQKNGNKIYIALPITLSFAKLEFDKMGLWSTNIKSRYDKYNQRLSLIQEQEDQSEDLFNKFEARSDNQRKAILLAKMAEGQMFSMGQREAEEYYTQALETDPLSIYALVSYGRFKATLFDYSSAIDLIHQRAIPLITKKTAFYVYYNLADIYGQNREYSLKIKYLKEAMKYKENTSPYLYTMAQHSLGVALGKSNSHVEAIKNFDEIIERELTKPYGPSTSLVVAARTKKISLDRINPRESKSFLNNLIERCRIKKANDQIITDLIHIRDFE